MWFPGGGAWPRNDQAAEHIVIRARHAPKGSLKAGTMTSSDDDGTLPELDPGIADLLADTARQPIPPRLKLLAERLKTALDDALDEARPRRDN